MTAEAESEAQQEVSEVEEAEIKQGQTQSGKAYLIAVFTLDGKIDGYENVPSEEVEQIVSELVKDLLDGKSMAVYVSEAVAAAEKKEGP
jgi:hypothetical protein